MPIASIAVETQTKARSQPTASIGHISFLDGLRAVSIILVMGSHGLGPATGWLSTQLSGWVGVDLFFIISGFLITSILLTESDQKGAFSLRRFYMRRWLRIGPAYYTFLLAMLALTLVDGERGFRALGLAAIYLTDVPSLVSPALVAAGVMHTWSLSVEEQFYLLWPACLKLTAKRAWIACASVIAFVYAWRLWLLFHDCAPMRLSCAFDAKIDSIMFGVAVAFIWRSQIFQTRFKSHVSIRGCCLILLFGLLVSMHFLGNATIGTVTDQVFFFTAKLPVVQLLMAGLLISLLSSPNSLVGKFLSTPVMVWVGRLSYSLYLWHVVFVLPAIHIPLHALCPHSHMLEIVKYMICFALAAISYYCVEKPFLKLKKKYS